MFRTFIVATIFICALLGSQNATAADDRYFDLTLGSLTITEGELPSPEEEPDWENWERAQFMRPYVVLEGKAEAYLELAPHQRWEPPPSVSASTRLLIRAPGEGDVAGRLFVPNEDFSGMDVIGFSAPASAAAESAKNAFLLAKESHYRGLINLRVPGGAWFRHQARQANAARTDRPAEPPQDDPQREWQDRFEREEEMSGTFALFTGGRAVSENLQLDRVLPALADKSDAVDLESIEGISVRAMNWDALIKDAKPQPDPLAAAIPADQHAIFFPSFAALVKLVDEAQSHGTPVLRLVDVRSENAHVRERYERQLCLSLDGLSRVLGPQMIKSVAITGSDPYYRTGTDVAVLFEPVNAAALKAALLTQMTAMTQGNPAAKPIQGEVSGIAYSGSRSDDRSVCCHIATIGDVVIVTNSLKQLERLAAVHTGSAPAAASLGEYTFFRDRYQRSDEQETALIFLSDDTIRRWCGPRWRIATSRRTRAAAVMADLQAEHLDKLARSAVEAGPIHTTIPLADAGELRLTPRGVYSAAYNTLEFLTPIAEMDIDKVTKGEAEGYNRWRDTYQQNWRQFFDPIAIRLGVQADRLLADVSVMPLILGSDYRTMAAIAEGASIDPTAGDPHDALFHAIMAINVNSPTVQAGSNFAAQMAPELGVNALSWLGQSIAIYADPDPFWEEMARAIQEEEEEEFMEANQPRMPLALNAQVKDRLKLAAFLTALRAFAQQTAPGMIVWESLTYNEQPYVRLTPSEEAKAEQGEEIANLAIYYATIGDSLVVTPSESLLKRAMDRHAAGKAPIEGNAEPVKRPVWLGESLAMRLSKQGLDAAATLFNREWQKRLQLRAWGNIPILNEWKRLYPDQDPVKLHEKLWHATLICPGGGSYAWNEQYQTMESTLYGSPASPKDGPDKPEALQSLKSGEFGVTYENDGLRARTQIMRKEAKH